MNNNCISAFLPQNKWQSYPYYWIQTICFLAKPSVSWLCPWAVKLPTREVLNDTGPVKTECQDSHLCLFNPSIQNVNANSRWQILGRPFHSKMPDKKHSVRLSMVHGSRSEVHDGLSSQYREVSGERNRVSVLVVRDDRPPGNWQCQKVQQCLRANRGSNYQTNDDRVRLNLSISTSEAWNTYIQHARFACSM